MARYRREQTMGITWPLVSDSRLTVLEQAGPSPCDKDMGEEQEGTEATHVYVLVPSACTGSLREKNVCPCPCIRAQVGCLGRASLVTWE